MDDGPTPTATTMRAYTIFDHPKDHPDAVVIRGYDIVPGVLDPIPTPDCLEFRDLLSARLWVIFNEPDTVPIPRAPEDDPVIVETWM